MYTEYTSQNFNNSNNDSGKKKDDVNKDPSIYVTDQKPTFFNRVFGFLWKILLVVIVLILLFLGLLYFGIISLDSDVAPEAILLNQNEIGIKKGGTYQFVYSVLPENANNKQVVWTSSDPSVVRVNEATGFVEALKEGSATVKVKTLINEKESECLVNVSDKNILLTGININERYISLAVGYSTQLSYKTYPSTATELGLKFSSSDQSVAKVNSKGVITGVKEGSAIITVSSNNGLISDTAYVTVYKKGQATVVEGETIHTSSYPESINITEESVNLTLDSRTQLIAEVKPATASSYITWSSSNASVATVDKNGLVTAKGVGTATIVAKTVNNLTDTCEVTVGNYSNKLKGISISTTYSVLPVGSNRQLVIIFNPASATNKTVTWSSSNTSIATVDQSGNVRTLNPGEVTITAVAADGGYKASTPITVTGGGNLVEETAINFPEATYSVGVNQSVTLTPIISPANASFKAVSFESSDTSIATVDNNGVVKGIRTGRVTITAKTKRNQLKATVTVNVTNIGAIGVKLSTTSATIKRGDTYTLNATVTPDNASNKTMTFKSENTSIATVDENGIIRGVGVGQTTIIVTPNGGGNPSTCIVIVK